MLIGEFNSRFASKEEGGTLFEALRGVSRLEPQLLLAADVVGWSEWPPDDGSKDPDDPPSLGFAMLARAGA